MVLAAGLEGIAEKLDPGDPHLDNMYLKTPEELAALGIRTLPRSLDEALGAFAADPLSREVFGPEMYRAWLDFKTDEWTRYANHVGDWEKARYLKMF
jgi:glutamine synthetase